MTSLGRAPAADTSTFTEELLRHIALSRGEPDWLLARRLEAWRDYVKLPMPSRKEEEWRRTDLSMLDLEAVVPYVAQSPAVQRRGQLPEDVQAVLKAEDGEGGLSVQIDSSGAYCELSAKLAAKGVVFTDLGNAVIEYPDLVRQHLMRQTAPGDGKFAALHSAFWSSGAFVYVPQNVEAEMPLHTLTWVETEGIGVLPHTLVVLESGASLVLVEEYGSLASRGPILANSGVEIVLGAGARLHYVSLQRWGRGTFNIGATKASVGRDANLTTLSVVLGSKMTKSWAETALRDPGANVHMVGAMLGRGDQRFHHHTLQDHQAPNTSSDLLYKVALSDNARSEYSGLIHVHKFAARTDAYQANRNLLLSSNARADSMPKLEIENNDVRCTHGATVGPLDEEQLFYLMARGLPRNLAQQMIVRGFFEPVIDKIPLEGIRDRVREAIDAKLSTDAIEQ